MTVVLYVADLRDPTLETKMVDFNGANRGVSPLVLLHDFDIGSIATEAEWLTQSPRPGAVQVTRRHPIVTTQFRVRATDTTISKLNQTLALVQLALDQNGVLVFKETNQAETYYMDFFPSPLPEYYRGQERSVYKMLNLLTDVDGLPITIWRHPYRRLAQRDASVNLSTNGTLLEDAANDGRPDGWTWESETNLSAHAIRWNIPGAAFLEAAYEFTMATTGPRNLRQVVTPAAPAEVWTFSFEAAATSGVSLTVTPKARAVIEFLSAADAVLATATGSLVNITYGSGWSHPSVTSSAAPANTTKIRCTMRLEPTSADPHQVWLRNAQAEISTEFNAFRAGATVVTNDVTATNGKSMWVYNQGNVPAIAQVRITPDAGASVIRAALATRSGYRDTAEFGNIRADFTVRAANCTLSNGTADAADAASTGSFCAETTFSGTTMLKRWRREIVPTDATSLQGVFHVYVAVSGAISSEFPMQLRYGLGDIDDLPYALDSVLLDTTDAVAREYEIVRLGSVTIDQAATGLYLEGWAKRASGSGTLRWDSVWLMPADEQFTMVVLPGQEEPVLTKTDKWIGSDLVLPTAVSGQTFSNGEVSGADMILRPTTDPSGFLEAGGTEPDTGFTLASATQHTVGVTCTIFENAATGVKQGELRVYDITATTQVAKRNLNGTLGQRWSNNKLFTITFTPTAGHLYQYYVVYTSGMTLGQGNIHVLKITDTYTPPIVGTPSQTIAMDGDTRRVYTRQSGMFASPLVLSEGGLIEIPPGPVLLRCSVADNPGTGHMNPKHVPTRTSTVAVNLIIRYA